MDAEWDPDKATENYKKHGVDFADAATVLDDELAVRVSDDATDEEERFITVGRDALGRILTVVYTWRGIRPRLISARKATSREAHQYERKR